MKQTFSIRFKCINFKWEGCRPTPLLQDMVHIVHLIIFLNASQATLWVQHPHSQWAQGRFKIFLLGEGGGALSFCADKLLKKKGGMSPSCWIEADKRIITF